jgi:hypothetical protein
MGLQKNPDSDERTLGFPLIPNLESLEKPPCEFNVSLVGPAERGGALRTMKSRGR